MERRSETYWQTSAGPVVTLLVGSIFGDLGYSADRWEESEEVLRKVSRKVAKYTAIACLMHDGIAVP